MLNAHVDRYCWIPSDYESAAWDRQHFIGMLKQLLKGTSDPVRKLEALKTQPASLRKKKDRIIKELDLDQETVKLFEAVADAGYLLDYKKERFTLSHYHMRHWIEEAAKRLNISIRQLRYMTMDEVKAALVNNRIDTAELDERYNYCVVIVDENGAEFYYKDEAKEMFRLFQPTVDGDKTEIQGTCAQAGTVRGYARVMLSSRDQSKMQDGEVLITTMTTPDFVPAMKKAKAIITDEGGITCHAAIVSRELGTPCVVGTKIATRFFRTGDLVEIHAASGIVRKMG
ncbi:hypothetical protein KY362_01490 [Candidatus Woesearchaeota archaeon]|nr:hypothetical protein [Candidatus Woesearchaeota archaeon]